VLASLEFFPKKLFQLLMHVGVEKNEMHFYCNVYGGAHSRSLPKSKVLAAEI